jgi:Ni,Fe-hydrogenase I large subunit
MEAPRGALGHWVVIENGKIVNYGRLPADLHLIGTQPADLSVGLGLSATVEAALPQLVERAVGVTQAWRLTAAEPRQ